MKNQQKLDHKKRNLSSILLMSNSCKLSGRPHFGQCISKNYCKKNPTANGTILKWSRLKIPGWLFACGFIRGTNRWLKTSRCWTRVELCWQTSTTAALLLTLVEATCRYLELGLGDRTKISYPDTTHFISQYDVTAQIASLKVWQTKFAPNWNWMMETKFS